MQLRILFFFSLILWLGALVSAKRNGRFRQMGGMGRMGRMGRMKKNRKRTRQVEPEAVQEKEKAAVEYGDSSLKCETNEAGDKDCLMTLESQELEIGDDEDERRLEWIGNREHYVPAKEALCYKWTASHNFSRRSYDYRATLCVRPTYNGAEMTSMTCRLYGSCVNDKNLGGYLTTWTNGGCSTFLINKASGCYYSAQVSCSGMQCYNDVTGS